MHYGIITYGSRGDVQPYIALALGLMDNGHAVTLFANENFEVFVRDYGIEFYPLPGNMEAMVHSPQVLKILKSGNMISFLRELQTMTRKVQPLVNAKILGGCRKPEVLIASPLAMIWVHSIAEKLQKKWGIVQLSFPTIPTKAFPFQGFSFLDFSAYNLFTHRLVRYVYWRLNKKDVANHRKSLDLPAQRESILTTIARQKILNLYAISPSLIQRPDDWSDNNDVTGFLTIPTAKRKSIGAELPNHDLVKWLLHGEPPVYIGFGSIPIPDPKKFSAILHAMTEGTTHRFVFCQGWSMLPFLPRHQNVFAVKSISHDWLFPQCKSVIVHGGIGTLAAALRASVPPIVVSIFGDQPMWGKLVERKNLGVHIPFRRLTEGKLIHALDIVRQELITENVRRMGKQLNAEDGVSVAVGKMESYFGGK